MSCCNPYHYNIILELDKYNNIQELDKYHHWLPSPTPNVLLHPRPMSTNQINPGKKQHETTLAKQEFTSHTCLLSPRSRVNANQIATLACARSQAAQVARTASLWAWNFCELPSSLMNIKHVKTPEIISTRNQHLSHHTHPTKTLWAIL